MVVRPEGTRRERDSERSAGTLRNCTVDFFNWSANCCLSAPYIGRLYGVDRGERGRKGIPQIFGDPGDPGSTGSERFSVRTSQNDVLKIETLS
jgi:hypothetical protein